MDRSIGIFLSALSAMAVCLVWTTPSYAAAYRWIDAGGQTQFTDVPPPPGCQTPSCKAIQEKLKDDAAAAESSDPGGTSLKDLRNKLWLLKKRLDEAEIESERRLLSAQILVLEINITYREMDSDLAESRRETDAIIDGICSGLTLRRDSIVCRDPNSFSALTDSNSDIALPVLRQYLSDGACRLLDNRLRAEQTGRVRTDPWIVEFRHTAEGIPVREWVGAVRAIQDSDCERLIGDDD